MLKKKNNIVQLIIGGQMNNDAVIQKEIKDAQEVVAFRSEDFFKRCRATGMWDGKIRNGIPSDEAAIQQASQFADVDVRVQIALQIERKGGW